MDAPTWDWTPFEEESSDSEEEIGKPWIVDPRPKPDELVQIEKQISNLEEEIKSLRMHRSKVLSDSALINIIPAELLARVFEHGVHAENDVVHTIGLVSRHWRAISVTTPSLWSYIRLDTDWFDGRAEAFIRKIKLYTDRSQTVKILVDLNFHFCENLEDAEAIMAAIHPHLTRCYSIKVSVSDWHWMAPVVKHAGGMQESLEEVYIAVDPDGLDEGTTISFLEGVFPYLTSVTLGQAPLRCLFSKALMPSLQHFNIVRQSRHDSSRRMRIPLREYLSALTMSDARLKSLRLQAICFELDGSEGIFQHPRSALTTRLPCLTSLAISRVHATNICLFFDSVDLPAVERIAVEMKNNHEGDNPLWVAHLGLASEQGRLPALRHLELRACAANDLVVSSMIGAFRQLPQLTHLGLSEPTAGRIGPQFFNTFAKPASSGEWLLPRIQVISLTGCRELTGHEVLKIVRARRHPPDGDVVERVRMVRLVTRESLDADVIDLIRQNVDELKLSR